MELSQGEAEPKRSQSEPTRRQKDPKPSHSAPKPSQAEPKRSRAEWKRLFCSSAAPYAFLRWDVSLTLHIWKENNRSAVPSGESSQNLQVEPKSYVAVPKGAKLCHNTTEAEPN